MFRISVRTRVLVTYGGTMRIVLLISSAAGPGLTQVCLSSLNAPWEARGGFQSRRALSRELTGGHRRARSAVISVLVRAPGCRDRVGRPYGRLETLFDFEDLVG